MRRKKYICLLIISAVIVIFAVSKFHKESLLLITEVCSRNRTIAYDAYGDFTDYVEVYNNSDIPLDLSTFYLSDEETLDELYELPDEILEPGEYKVVFPIDVFSLSEGETLYLSDNMGKIIDRVEIKASETDKSLARDLVTMEWIENGIPTPGEKTIYELEEMSYLPQGSTPVFSKEPGFYEKEFYLELSTNGNYDIYYTLDGTSPDESSLLYTEPILITEVTKNPNVYSAIEEITVNDNHVLMSVGYQTDKCNVIRAIAVGKNGEVSEEVSGTYFVNYENRKGYQDIYILSLTTDPDNLFSREQGIYVTGRIADENWYALSEEEKEELNHHYAIANYNKSGEGWKRPATIELFDKEKKRIYQQDVKIGIHGNWSTIFSQKSFNLIANGEEEYVFPGLFGEENTSLMLRSGGYRDWKDTKFRDALNQKLMENRAVTVLHAVPCQVFIDGEYWGVYNLQERIDRGLIASNFGVQEEDVIVFKNGNVVGNDDNYYGLYSEVVAFAANNDLSLSDNYKIMEDMIDIQSYIDYYCFQIYVANCDSVSNNYSCWRTLPVSDADYYDGKWRWVLYDTDDSLGMVSDLAEVNTDSFRAGHWANAPMDDPLFSSLVKNEEFKERFVTTFMELADTVFLYKNVNTVIDELESQYINGMLLFDKRFRGGDLTPEGYKERVQVVRDFFRERRKYIIPYMEEALGVEVESENAKTN